MFGRKGVETYFCVPLNEWPVRLSVRTAPFHGAKTGSIPVPATRPAFSGLFYCILWIKDYQAGTHAAIFTSTLLSGNTKNKLPPYFIGYPKRSFASCLAKFRNPPIPKWVRKCELLYARKRNDLRNLSQQTDLFT